LSFIFIPILSDSEELLTSTLNSVTDPANMGELSPLVSLLLGEIENDSPISSDSDESPITHQGAVTPSIITPPSEDPSAPEPNDPIINPPAVISTILTPIATISNTDTTHRYHIRRSCIEMPNSDSGNKYLVNNFNMNRKNFTVEITNQQNGVTGDGYYEIKTYSGSDHDEVLQSGTFSQTNGTVLMFGRLTFTPKNNTEYYILVYTHYPEEDNRVSKSNTMYTNSENDEESERSSNS
jgi:hypothetical protein